MTAVEYLALFCIWYCLKAAVTFIVFSALLVWCTLVDNFDPGRGTLIRLIKVSCAWPYTWWSFFTFDPYDRG